jgi:nitroreductase
MDGDAEARALMRLLMARRSVRSYGPRDVDDSHIDRIEAAASSMPSVHGLGSGRAFLVRDRRRASDLTDALISGWAGKVNLWLARGHRPPAYVVCAGDPASSPVRDGRHLYNVDAAVAGEAAVLEAASLGVDSVWMAGIGERRVVEFLGLEGGRVNAVIALGHARRGGVWDAVTQGLVSGRRRPLASMAFEERFGAPLPVEPPDHTRRGPMAAHHGGAAVGASVRLPAPSHAFGGTPSASQMRLVLDAARWAPSADNLQPWRWILVRGRAREVLDAAGVPDAASCGEFLLLAACAAPVLIERRTREQPFALIDVPIAIVHAIAMAAAMGHGWNMLAEFDYPGAARALSLPPGHEAIALVMLGRPVEAPRPAWQQMLPRPDPAADP